MILYKMPLKGRKRIILNHVIIIVGLIFFVCFDCISQTVSQPEKDLTVQKYSTFDSFDEMLNSTDTRYFESVRISPVGTKKKPMYNSFFYYNHTQTECLQFEPSGRYLLGMRVFIEGRDVQPFDKAETGMYDLQNKNKWIKIGETTTWNYQQGCRLQWVPGFEEIIWNDRSDDGKSLITRVYNVKSKSTRILPFPVYVTTSDGKKGLCVNYERVQHRGCKYAGIEDPYKDQWAPDKIGIWEIDMATGEKRLLLSLKEMAKVMFPKGFPSDTTNRNLYFFRVSYNPSGTRIFAFVKDFQNVWGNWSTRTEGYTMTPDGKNIRYFYKEPSHHFWFNDDEVVDNGFHQAPNEKAGLGYYRFKDDGSGQAKEKILGAPNGHITINKTGDWILTDGSDGDGYIYLYLYHIPTRKIVPLAKLETQIGGYIYKVGLGALRCDLHPRFSYDGKSVSFDSTHEGFGRQIYLMDISSIIDNPPHE